MRRKATDDFGCGNIIELYDKAIELLNILFIYVCMYICMCIYIYIYIQLLMHNTYSHYRVATQIFLGRAGATTGMRGPPPNRAGQPQHMLRPVHLLRVY